MAITDRLWDTLGKVIKMNDRVETLSATVDSQQRRIQVLADRIIRLEAIAELAFAHVRTPAKSSPTRRARTPRLPRPKA